MSSAMDQRVIDLMWKIAETLNEISRDAKRINQNLEKLANRYEKNSKYGDDIQQQQEAGR